MLDHEFIEISGQLFVEPGKMQLPILVHFGSNPVQSIGPKRFWEWLTAFREIRQIANLIRNQQIEVS